MSAVDVMRGLNPHALVAQEGGKAVFIEDHRDPDGRTFRLEYQCNSDGSNAVAICRHNPWGSNPLSAASSHLFSDGRICLGDHAFTLQDAVQRARFWCTGYSYLREHGRFPSEGL